jgi:hypothetical protein
MMEICYKMDQYDSTLYVAFCIMRDYDDLPKGHQEWLRAAHSHLMECSNHEHQLEHILGNLANNPKVPDDYVERFIKTKERLTGLVSN